MEVLQDVFIGSSDECERLVACLQYCSFLPMLPSPEITQIDQTLIVNLLEKGNLYREMIDLNDFTLLDKCFYLTQKFSEFGDRLEIIDKEIQIIESNISDVLVTSLSRIKSILTFNKDKVSALRSFVMIKCQDLYLICHYENMQTNQIICYILSQHVYVLRFTWQDIEIILKILLKIMEPLLPKDHYYSMNMMTLVQLPSMIESIQLFDDQILRFHEFIRDSKKEEAAHNILGIRESLKYLYQSAQDGKIPEKFLSKYNQNEENNSIPPPITSPSKSPKTEKTILSPVKEMTNENFQQPLEYFDEEDHEGEIAGPPPVQSQFACEEESKDQIIYEDLSDHENNNESQMNTTESFVNNQPENSDDEDIDLIHTLKNNDYHTEAPLDDTEMHDKEPLDLNISTNISTIDHDYNDSVLQAIRKDWNTYDSQLDLSMNPTDKEIPRPEISMTPSKPVPKTNHLVNIETNPMITQSLVNNLMESEEDEDFSQYITRAYLTIRDKGVDTAFENIRESTLGESWSSTMNVESLLNQSTNFPSSRPTTAQPKLDANAMDESLPKVPSRPGTSQSKMEYVNLNEKAQPNADMYTVPKEISRPSTAQPIISRPSTGLTENKQIFEAKEELKEEFKEETYNLEDLSLNPRPGSAQSRPLTRPNTAQSINDTKDTSELFTQNISRPSSALPLDQKYLSRPSTGQAKESDFSELLPTSPPGDYLVNPIEKNELDNLVSESYLSRPNTAKGKLFDNESNTLLPSRPSTAQSQPSEGKYVPSLSRPLTARTDNLEEIPKVLTRPNTAQMKQEEVSIIGEEDSYFKKPSISRPTTAAEAKEILITQEQGQSRPSTSYNNTTNPPLSRPSTAQSKLVENFDEIPSSMISRPSTARVSPRYEPEHKLENIVSEVSSYNNAEMKPLSRPNSSRQMKLEKSEDHLEPTFVSEIDPNNIIQELNPRSRPLTMNNNTDSALTVSRPGTTNTRPNSASQPTLSRPVTAETHEESQHEEDLTSLLLNYQSNLPTNIASRPSSAQPYMINQANNPSRGNSRPGTAQVLDQDTNNLSRPLTSQGTLSREPSRPPTAQFKETFYEDNSRPKTSHGSRPVTAEAKESILNTLDSNLPISRPSTSTQPLPPNPPAISRAQSKDEMSVITESSQPKQSILSIPPYVIKNQIILDQMRSLQSKIEYDYIEARIVKNKRRVSIGLKVLELLNYQQSEDNQPLSISLDNLTSEEYLVPMRSSSHLKKISPNTSPINLKSDHNNNFSAPPTKIIPGGVVWNIDVDSLPSNGRPRSRARPSTRDSSREAPREIPQKEIIRETPRETPRDATRLPPKDNNRDLPKEIPLPSEKILSYPSNSPRETFTETPKVKPNVMIRPIIPTKPERNNEIISEEMMISPTKYLEPKLGGLMGQPSTSEKQQPRPRPSSRSASRSRNDGHKLSNLMQTKNAITYVCLAGSHQEEKRFEVLELLEYYAHGTITTISSNDSLFYEEFKGSINQFVLMFYKSKSLAFKAVYVVDPTSKSLLYRIYGKGPQTIPETENQIIKEFMKFETSAKSFKSLPVKSISSTVDAIILEPPKNKVIPF